MSTSIRAGRSAGGSISRPRPRSCRSTPGSCSCSPTSASTTSGHARHRPARWHRASASRWWRCWRRSASAWPADRPGRFPAAAVFMVLAPTSSVVPIPDAAVEHRLYLPVLGIAVLLVSGILGLDRDAAPRRRLAVAALTGLILWLASLSLAATRSTATAKPCGPMCSRPRPGNLRAAIYQGRFGDPQREMARFRAVLAEFPAMTDARLALAVDLLQVGRPLEAEAEPTGPPQAMPAMPRSVPVSGRCASSLGDWRGP